MEEGGSTTLIASLETLSHDVGNGGFFCIFMGDVDSEVLAFLYGVNVVEVLTPSQSLRIDFKGLMPVLDFIVALVPPWK